MESKDDKLLRAKRGYSKRRQVLSRSCVCLGLVIAAILILAYLRYQLILREPSILSFRCGSNLRQIGQVSFAMRRRSPRQIS